VRNIYRDNGFVIEGDVWRWQRAPQPACVPEAVT
jgi:hypothetical protein